jgi:poly-gamma-glutamate capsule biosynthesis protein CapA/YwtB (metallophosphatase superfamily)
MNENPSEPLRLFLCGDVMTGRGVDQLLPHPSDPELHEPGVGDARSYVQHAERANGFITQPVAFDYIWGDALDVLRRAKVDARIANLETSITTSDDFWPDKGIHYRMNPRNVACITAAKIDCCCLANNHVMDWGYAGLDETLHTLDAAGVRHAGAGKNAREAAAPAVIEAPGKCRVLVFAFGSVTSGIPWEWRAGADQTGINLLEDLRETTAHRIADEMFRFAQPGDVLIASIHWGGNWGYQVPKTHVCFAHCLVERGIAVIHGHSSHHVRPIEVYDERLILYGCGDFINDYEGIAGYETFRDDLALMYLVEIDPRQSRLKDVRLVPMQMRRFRLNHASLSDARWLCDLITRLGAPSRLEADKSIVLGVPEWSARVGAR